MHTPAATNRSESITEFYVCNLKSNNSQINHNNQPITINQYSSAPSTITTTTYVGTYLIVSRYGVKLQTNDWKGPVPSANTLNQTISAHRRTRSGQFSNPNTNTNTNTPIGLWAMGYVSMGDDRLAVPRGSRQLGLRRATRPWKKRSFGIPRRDGWGGWGGWIRPDAIIINHCFAVESIGIRFIRSA